MTRPHARIKVIAIISINEDACSVQGLEVSEDRRRLTYHCAEETVPAETVEMLLKELISVPATLEFRVPLLAVAPSPIPTTGTDSTAVAVAILSSNCLSK